MNRRLKNIVLLVATVVTIFCILLGSAIHIGMPIMRGLDDLLNSIAAGHIDISAGTTFADQDLSDVSDVVLDLSVSDLKIVKGSTNHITVKANKEKYAPKFEANGSTLKIYQNDFKGPNNSSDLGIEVVVTLKNSLDSLEGTVALGDLDFDGVDVKNFDVTLNLGDVDITSAVIDKLDLNLDLGDADIKNVAFKNATVECSLGDLNCELPFSLDNCSMELNVGLGDIKVAGNRVGSEYHTKGGDCEFKAKCDLGNIEISGR